MLLDRTVLPNPMPPVLDGGAATSPSPWSGQTLGSLEYVRRGPTGTTIDATIEMQVFPDRAERVPGGFLDAVLRARELAKAPVTDGIHQLVVNQAHGVLQAADGAFWIAPLGGDHRGFRGPLFIDGEMGRRVALSVFGQRTHEDLEAVVGEEQVIDLRTPRSAGMQSIDGFVARERAVPGPGRRVPVPEGTVPAVPVPSVG